MPNLLEIHELQTWFPIRRGILSRTVGYVRAVDGVSLEVAQGETLGLVGESGCGKTTLARTIMRLDPARQGSIVFDGENLLRSNRQRRRALHRELQIVFQDPFASLNPRMTVASIITEGMLSHGMITASQAPAEAARLLHEVGLDADALHRYPHEFSGGQRQRISIARALAVEPRMIICDEAVSALDVSIQAQVINLLLELKKRRELSYIFISHDLSVVRHIADRVAVMYVGQIVETGTTDEVIRRPAHPYTRALISAIPRAGEKKRERVVLPGDVPSPARPPSGCRFHPRCPYVIDACRRITPQLSPPEAHPDRPVACIRKDEI